MNSRALEKIGLPPPLVPLAKQLVAEARRAGVGQQEIRGQLAALVSAPEQCTADPHFGRLARDLVQQRAAGTPSFSPRRDPAPWRQWGSDIDEQALGQMRQAVQLPVAVAAALMPDAHVGYGLPIGGVLAPENAVVPYAVGVDIACRMKLSVLDLPTGWLQSKRDRLARALEV